MREMQQGYTRLSSGRLNGLPSPPSSPISRPVRSKSSVGSLAGKAGKQGLAEKLAVLVVSVVFRRRGLLFFAPLLYITGMLLYMGSFGFDVGVRKGVVGVPAPPGSVYRSPQAFEKLWPFMEAGTNETYSTVIEMLWGRRGEL